MKKTMSKEAYIQELHENVTSRDKTIEAMNTNFNFYKGMADARIQRLEARNQQLSQENGQIKADFARLNKATLDIATAKEKMGAAIVILVNQLESARVNYDALYKELRAK